MRHFEKAFCDNHQKLLAMFLQADANRKAEDELIAALGGRPLCRPETRVEQ